ncbi:hypothetical protein PN462_11235 [Spirulina sp. CS-785/01]|uniref:hypothetical protein n=1 Tax=Spirulina sp. CS-785/01 TaxID=3021716 RepID=UPI00232FD151|nr:hypothetical protein [Spirulina sp. CS-785/01]MDB9313674.1 hypothetical protein [Spirulina sp. CS-785/01]
MFKPQSSQSQSSPDPAALDAQGYRPSVPITVYRQLAQELQVTKEEMSHLQRKNQHLMEQNTLMREELAKISQSVETLQQVTASYDGEGNVITSEPPKHQETEIQESPEPSLALSNFEDDFESSLVMEVEEKPERRPSLQERMGDANGWLVVVTLVFVVLTVFGGTYLLVRPLFSNNNGGSN